MKRVRVNVPPEKRNSYPGTYHNQLGTSAMTSGFKGMYVVWFDSSAVDNIPPEWVVEV